MTPPRKRIKNNKKQSDSSSSSGSQHENNRSNNRFNNSSSLILPSPPSQQYKLPYEEGSHQHRGRPPSSLPFSIDSQQSIDYQISMTVDSQDSYVLQDLRSFLYAQQEEELCQSPSIDLCFDIMNEQQMDFDLYDLLDGSSTNTVTIDNGNDDEFSFYSATSNDFFPDLLTDSSKDQLYKK